MAVSLTGSNNIKNASSPVKRYPGYVKHKVFAVWVCKGTEPCSFKFIKPKSEQKGTVSITSKNLMEPLRTVMADVWEKDKRYRVRGFWVADAKTMCCDLTESVQEDFRNSTPDEGSEE